MKIIFVHARVVSPSLYSLHDKSKPKNQNLLTFLVTLRVSSHERPMNSNRYGISFRLKISLQCSVSSLLVFTWAEAKWNSKRYGLHIGHFDQNEFQTGIRFSCEHNLPKAKWISADSLDVAINAHVRLKVNAGMDFISVILTEMKFLFGW